MGAMDSMCSLVSGYRPLPAAPGRRQDAGAPCFAASGRTSMQTAPHTDGRPFSKRAGWCIAVLLGGLGSGSCSSAAEPAPIRYLPASIEHHGDGSIAVALLDEPAAIQGLPCRSWVRFHQDGRLSTCELAAEAA